MRFILRLVCLHMLAAGTLICQSQQNTLQYESITGADRREGATQHKNVVASLPGTLNGHVVLQCNKPDRVWDGNSVVRLKESLARIKDGISETLSDDPKENRQRQMLLTDLLSPGHYRAFQDSRLDTKKLLQMDDLRALTANLDTEKLLAIYSAEGNRVSLSFTHDELKNAKWFKSSQPLDIRYSREIFSEVKRAAESGASPLACNQLIQKILKDDRLQGANANQIDTVLRKDAEQTAERQRRESQEPPRDIDYRGDKDKPVLGKPGGTILGTMAEIANLTPREIRSVTFDRVAGRLVFQTNTGPIRSFPIDLDVFAVAVRSIYIKNADPVLSMGFDPVSYTHLTLPTICSV